MTLTPHDFSWNTIAVCVTTHTCTTELLMQNVDLLRGCCPARIKPSDGFKMAIVANWSITQVISNKLNYLNSNSCCCCDIFYYHVVVFPLLWTSMCTSPTYTLYCIAWINQIYCVQTEVASIIAQKIIAMASWILKCRQKFAALTLLANFLLQHPSFYLIPRSTTVLVHVHVIIITSDVLFCAYRGVGHHLMKQERITNMM